MKPPPNLSTVQFARIVGVKTAVPVVSAYDEGVRVIVGGMNRWVRWAKVREVK